jgi:ferredoxin
MEEVYRKLCETMAKRGGRYPGTDIPEFYDLVQVLFTPQEAEISTAMPRGFNSAEEIAKQMGKDPREIAEILEQMAQKGLCISIRKDDTILYAGLPFMVGIFEYQFMRGTTTERDRNIARLIHVYKKAVDAIKGPPKITFPTTRVIPVNRKIKAGSRIHTYDQVKSYIEKYDPLAVSTCYCRHEARLLEDNTHCGRPDDVCLQFGEGAQFVIDRGSGRKISKDEALEILERAEEAGLVHATLNRQEIDFLCNCCSCHCVILKTALAQPKPGLSMNSGYQPSWDHELCIGCETCIERCPMDAIEMGEHENPTPDLNRCIGCGVCASGCPESAITLVERPGIPEPPVDRKALKEAVKASMNKVDVIL